MPRPKKKKKKTKPAPHDTRLQFLQHITITEFSTEKERTRYDELHLMLRNGAIDNLRYKVPYLLTVVSPVNGRNVRLCTFIASFVYYDVFGNRMVEDASASPFRRTTIYKLKKKLMEGLLNIKLREV